MLNLKKKREAQAKANAAAAAAEQAAAADVGKSSPTDAPQQVAIFNRFKKDKVQSGNGRNRTMGEIRIQKGTFRI